MTSRHDLLIMEQASLRGFAIRYSFLGFLMSLMLLVLLSGCASVFEQEKVRHNTVAGERRVPALNPGGNGRASSSQAATQKVHKPVFEPNSPPQNPLQVPNYTASQFPTPPYQPPFQQVSGPVMLQPVIMPMPQQMMMGNPMMMNPQMAGAMGAQPMVNTGGAMMPPQNMQAMAGAPVNQEIVTGPILNAQQAINLQQPGANISPLAQPSVNAQTSIADLKRQRAIAESAQIVQANRQMDNTWVDGITSTFTGDENMTPAPQPMPSYEMAALPPQPMPQPAPYEPMMQQPAPSAAPMSSIPSIEMPDPMAPAAPGAMSSPGFDPYASEPAASFAPAPQILPLPATDGAIPGAIPAQPEFGAAMPGDTGELLRRSASSAPVQQQQTIGGLTLTPPDGRIDHGDFLPDSRYNRRF